jgi:hypothetical protein
LQFFFKTLFVRLDSITPDQKVPTADFHEKQEGGEIERENFFITYFNVEIESSISVKDSQSYTFGQVVPKSHGIGPRHCPTPSSNDSTGIFF